MDTISRENNSILPVAGVVVGVLALLLGGFALVKASGLQKSVAAQDEKLARVDEVQSQVGAVSAANDKNARDIKSLTSTTQDAFNTVSGALGSIQAAITKLEEQRKPAAAAANGNNKGAAAHTPAVAGPGEYVIKSGDTGMKIASANGVSVSDLQAVNQGVNWNGLRPGQKLKLPKK
jgi:LysM repeat protein